MERCTIVDGMGEVAGEVGVCEGKDVSEDRGIRLERQRKRMWG